MASAEKLALYERPVATIPDVERKGATVPLALRLPADVREELLKKCKTRLCQA